MDSQTPLTPLSHRQSSRKQASLPCSTMLLAGEGAAEQRTAGENTAERNETPQPAVGDIGEEEETADFSRADSKDQSETDAVQYEYMELNCSEREHNPQKWDSHLPGAERGGDVERREGGERSDEEEEEEEEEEQYPYSDNQPVRVGVKGHCGEEAEVYEEMDVLGVARDCRRDGAEYQNMREGGGSGVGRAGLRGLLRVRAGVGEPGGGDCSFDNPEYWHSRLLMKPNAVRT